MHPVTSHWILRLSISTYFYQKFRFILEISGLTSNEIQNGGQRDCGAMKWLPLKLDSHHVTFNQIESSFNSK